LDIGALYTKAVVVQDGELSGWALAPTGDSSEQSATGALSEALAGHKASRNDLAAIAATGAGKQEVRFAQQQLTEILCAVQGAKYSHPQARGVIDLGGESTRAIKLDEQGQVADFALNEKCAAGTGIFLDAMGEVMGVSLEQMGPLSLESQADVNITSLCVVFAESEVVSLVHRQTPKADILRGIHKSIATRVRGLVNRIGLPEPTLAIGGLAQNVGIVTWLNELMNTQLVVPDNPQIVVALGAALLAGRQEQAS